MEESWWIMKWGSPYPQTLISMYLIQNSGVIYSSILLPISPRCYLSLYFFRNFKFLPTAYSLRVTYKISALRGNNIYWIYSLKYFRCAKSGLKFFRFVDIEITAWSPLFVNLKINIIFFWISRKVHKIQPIRVSFA